MLIAFDKFKGALSASKVCEVVAEVVRQERPTWRVHSMPFSDGGDGFCELLTRAAGGELVSVEVEHRLTSEGSQSVRAQFGRVAASELSEGVRSLIGVRELDTVGILDLASVDGLGLLVSADRNPEFATTQGTGQLLKACAQTGVDCILLGVGGSATNDLGLGALGELGLSYSDSTGARIVAPSPNTWSRLEHVEGRIEGLPALRVACDVDNPLLGARGATAVYGPQKGLDAVSCGRIERQADRVSALLCESLNRPESLRRSPGAGAAGGIAFGLIVAAGAELVPGFELVSQWLELSEHLQRAELIFTGEGRFDESSGFGKGPGTVVRRAVGQGCSVAVFAGSIELRGVEAALLEVVDWCEISPAGLPVEVAMSQTPQLLAQAVRAWLNGSVPRA